MEDIISLGIPDRSKIVIGKSFPSHFRNIASKSSSILPSESGVNFPGENKNP
ncbi:hypothetical protein D3C80_2214430 [compost metagenome]